MQEMEAPNDRKMLKALDCGGSGSGIGVACNISLIHPFSLSCLLPQTPSSSYVSQCTFEPFPYRKIKYACQQLFRFQFQFYLICLSFNSGVVVFSSSYCVFAFVLFYFLIFVSVTVCNAHTFSGCYNFCKCSLLFYWFCDAFFGWR